jgi:hypothetical protein
LREKRKAAILVDNLTFKLSGKGKVMARKFGWGLKADKVYTSTRVNPDGDVVVLNEKGLPMILNPAWYDVVTV